MKSSSLFPAVIVIAGFVLAPAGVFVARVAAQEPTRPAAQISGPADLASVLDAIRQAPEPSAAISAYVKGAAIAPNNPILQETFIRRMVELGLPQMASAQAAELTQQAPGNGLAWGVLAYTLGSRGQTSEALIDVARAVQYLPDDPFIQRTAGQLLAWYDVVADQSKQSDAVKQAAKSVRDKLENNRAYAEAYQAARRVYEEQNDTGQSTETTIVPPPIESEQTAPAETYNYNYYESPDVYPYAPYPDYLPYPAFVGGYYDGFWWPNTSSVIIVPPYGDEYFEHHHPFFAHHEPGLDHFRGFPIHHQGALFAGHYGHAYGGIGAFGNPGAFARGGNHGPAFGFSHSRGFAPPATFGRPGPVHSFSHSFAPSPGFRSGGVSHFSTPRFGGGRAPAFGHAPAHFGGSFRGGSFRGGGFHGGGFHSGGFHGGGQRR